MSTVTVVPGVVSAVAPSERVVGYDVARSLAILGMIVVHFSEMMASDLKKPAWAAWILRVLDGRAAATFVVLAGVGLSLLTRRARTGGGEREVAEARRLLVRRGLFLLVLGFVNLVVWPGDILRVYGISLMVAAALVTASDRRLIEAALAFAFGFIALLCVVDYDTHWDWSTMTYHGLWTPAGLFRNLVYDGYRSIFPWTGFLLFGMWLGRRDLREPSRNARVFVTAVALTLGAEGVSWLCVSYFLAHRHGMTADDVNAIFGTVSMPPLPLFWLSAVGTAVAVIALCVRLASAWPSAVWVRLLASTGQLSLTWYFAHLVVGIAAIVALDLENELPLPVAEAYGALFFAGAVVVSWLWKERFRHGPLEWLMRKVTAERATPTTVTLR